MLWPNRHRPYRDRLSVYIDGQLTGPETEALERHLAGCPVCRRQLDELRATVLALRDLPQEDVPRSFALTPEQAADPSPRPAPPRAPALATGARLAAAALAVALAAVLLVDLGDLGGGGGGPEAGAPVMQQPQARGELDARPLSANDSTRGVVSPTPSAGHAAGAPAGAPDAGPGTGGEAEGPATGGQTDQFAPQPTATPAPPTAAGPTPLPPGAPLPPDATAVPAGQADAFGFGATPLPVPEVGAREPPARREGGGGLDTLRVAEIALAVALGLSLAGVMALAFAGRKR